MGWERKTRERENSREKGRAEQETADRVLDND